MATVIDKQNGVWDLELAIYHPNANAYGSVAFNIGGSTGSAQSDTVLNDAYAYYTWQPNVPDNPFADPVGAGDPGQYNLVNSAHWAILNFLPGADDVIVRKEVEVPMVDPAASVVIDGVMNEASWAKAAHADLVTATGYEIYSLYYEYEKHGKNLKEITCALLSSTGHTIFGLKNGPGLKCKKMNVSFECGLVVFANLKFTSGM